MCLSCFSCVYDQKSGKKQLEEIGLTLVQFDKIQPAMVGKRGDRSERRLVTLCLKSREWTGSGTGL